MDKLIKDILLPSLISIQDLAFVEEASGTLGMLQLVDKILRYEVDEHKEALLEAEIAVMKAILELYRYRFGSFSYNLIWDESLKHHEIDKNNLIKALISILNEKLNEPSQYCQIELNVVCVDANYKFELQLR